MKAGEMITEIRKYRGKTRQELAEALKITKQRMGAIEAAQDVSFSTIQRVCAALDFEIMPFPMESRPKKQIADIFSDSNSKK
jgi:transcriptional regulator with XRE-family HTH domain